MHPAAQRVRRRRWWAWLVLVLVGLAAPLRLLWLDSYPPGLFYDPASEALDALAIVDGARPVFLPANNGREPLFVYLMAAVFGLTGPTVAGLRLTSSLLGLTGVVLAFVWARAWFGPRVALLTAGLMAASLWHVALSRFGTRSILLPVVEPLVVLLVWRAVRSGRLLTWAAAGLALGLGAYTYLSFRLFPIVVAGVIVGALVATRAARTGSARPRSADLARCARGVAVMLAVAAVVVAPLAGYFLDHPEDFGGRVTQVSLTTERDALARVGASFVETVGMFVVRGDHFPFFNLPDQPVFDHLVAPFFAIGLLVALWRVRRPRYALLLLWVGVMLVPGVLSVGAPNYQRTAGIMPAIFVLPALGLATTAAWLGRLWRRRASGRGWLPRVALPIRGLLVLAPLGLLVLTSTALTARAYFVDLLAVPKLWEWYETDVAVLGRHARGLPPDARVYALVGELPDVARADHAHATLDFLAGRRVHAFEHDLVAVADSERQAAVYLLPDPSGVPWQAILPPGRETWLTDPFSGRSLLSLAIPAGTASRPETVVQARWPNGPELVGSTLVRADGRTSELVLYWRPLASDRDADGRELGGRELGGRELGGRELGGRYVVSVLDGDGRDQVVARIPVRSLACPASACGDVWALARRIFLAPPGRSSPPPYTHRIRVQDGDGATLQPIDAAGRRINPVVRVARIDGRPEGR